MRRTIIWYFKVDGGIIPTHHQPGNVKIQTTGNRFEVWSTTKEGVFETYTQAVNWMKRNYDRIEQTGYETRRYREAKTRIKWEQTARK